MGANLVQIQTDSDWGQASSNINQNFAQLDVAVEAVKNATVKFKGYFSTEAALKSAYPSPKSGDTAWVGTPYPGKVYEVKSGQWSKTDTEPDTGEVNLEGYATKEDLASLEGKVGGVGYVLCETASGTAAKTITLTGLTALSTGIRLLVKMTNANTASNATFNINSLGAKPLFYNNKRVSTDNSWEDGEVIDIYYDGTNFYSSNVQGGSGASGNIILKWNTDAGTTRKQVKQSKRKTLLQISYNDADNKPINEQYIGTAFTDTEWAKDSNWERIPNQEKIIELENKIRDAQSSIDVNTTFTNGYGIVAKDSLSDYGRGGSSTVFSVSDYIACNAFDYIDITFPTAISDSTFGLVFYDNEKNPIKGEGYNKIISKTGTYSVENLKILIPKNAYFFRTTYFKDTETYGAFKATLNKKTFQDVQEQIDSINNTLDTLYKEDGVLDYVDYDKPVSWNYGYYLVADNTNPGGNKFGNIYSNASTSVTEFLDIDRAEEIEVSVFQSNTSTINGCVLYDYEKNPIKGYRFQNAGETKTIITKLTDIPSNAVFLKSSVVKGDEESFVLRIKKRNVTGIIPNIQKRLENLEYKDINVLNIKDYGAQDGANVKTIIRDMLSILEANGGGVIYAPKGTYLLEEPVRWKSNINLIGDGQGLTIFKPTSNLSAFVGDEISNFTFEKFTIDGVDQKKNQQLAYAKGIFQTKLTDVTYKDIDIKNTSATGLGVDYFISGIIENVRCDNCGRDADFLSNNAAGCSGIGIGIGAFQRGNESLTISNCHCNNCGQNGIFVETQTQVLHDTPVGTSIIGCTAEGNRTGFGVSGCDSVILVGCTAYNNHHAGFAYDGGTMNSGSTGKRPKFIGCIASNNGKNIPEDYPEYLDQENGFGWYILQNYQGIEMVSCNSISNLKSGIEVVNGITGLYIEGGEISENGEHGINLNGNISKFRISPTIIQSNTGDGIRINATLSKGFIKNTIVTSNNNGINRTDSGNIGDTIINDNFVYNNTTSDNNIVE